MRILIIEDDPSVANSLEIALAGEGIICDTAELGKQGLEICSIYEYSLIILDLLLPDMDGFELLLRFRTARIKVPVLILSGLTAPDQKIKALGIGADDYMTKPFNKEELIARIHAIVRRASDRSEATLAVGKHLVINFDSRIVLVNDIPVALTSKEYSLLELLALRKGTVLTKEMFLNHIYGGINEPNVKIVDVFICKVRKKLMDASGGINYIETIWGRGYTLKVEEDSMIDDIKNEQKS